MKETGQKRIIINEENFWTAIGYGVDVLQRGGVIAYPTETVYGFGALLSKDEGIERIRRIKGKVEPMLVLVSGEDMAKQYVEVDERAEKLIRRFWPGALTLVLKAKPGVSEKAKAGSKGLGVRRSSDRVAQTVVESLGEAIISTSANRSGEEPMRTGEEIEREFGAELDLILDAGIRDGLASTVIDLTGAELNVLREGEVKLEQIKLVLEWQE